MAALFAMATVVQVNDPDPFAWMAIYTAAAIVSALAALGRALPPQPLLAIALVAAVWAARVILSGPPLAEYLHMFDAWEMRSAGVEAAREGTGLLLVAAWTAALARRGRRRIVRPT